MKSKISIITPAYNREKCIGRAIESVLNQTYRNWELIIVDDGSMDNTAETVSRYLKDKRIKFFKLQKNKGVNFARAFGVKKAKGDFITLLDSDDELKKEALNQMNKDIPLFDKYNTNLIIYQAENEKNEVIDKDFIKKDLELITFKDSVDNKWPAGEIIPFLKKSIFEKVNFPNQNGGMEIIFWNRVLKHVSPALFRKMSLRIYHTESSDRLTGGGQTLFKARFIPPLYNIFLKEFKKDYEKYNPKKLAYFYLEKGIFEIINKQGEDGRISLTNSLHYNKKKIFLIVLLFSLSYLPNSLFLFLTQIGHKFKGIIK